MASASLGQLTLDLIARIGGFTAPMEQAEREAKKRAKGIKDAADDASSAWGNLGKVAAGAFAGISVAGVFARVIQETISAQQEQAQLAAVLKSTGEAAGYSQDELNGMADAMERGSTISAGEINQAQTTLLAFTGIVGQEFPRALQAAVDMASRTGMSVVSAAETIGRALDIPSKGLTALSKQGFRFTDDQKKLAEQLEATGHTAEAQGIILSALEESYGGAAQAARDTLGGALTGLQNTISGLLTGSGGSVDAATAAVNALNDALASPAAKTAIEGLTVAIGAAAAVITGRLVTSLGASAVAFAAAQKEAIRYQMALAAMQGISTRAAAGITAVSIASRGASAALAALGGPVGIALLAASAIVYFGSSASEAEEKTSGLKQEVDYLSASFEGLTKNQAAATLLDVQQQLNEAQLKAIDAGDAIHHYEELLRNFPDDGRAQEWNDSLVRARGEFDSASQVVSALRVKIEQLNEIIAKSNIDAAAGHVSKTYKDISSRIEEQILLHGKKTEAERLEAKINAGLVDGLLEGEGQKLIALQKTRDAQVAQEEAEKKSAQAAEAAAAKAKAAAKSRADEAARAVKAIDDQVASLQYQVKTLEMTASQERIFRLETEGATRAQIEQAKTALDAVDAFEKQKKAQEDYRSLVSSLRTEEEQLTDQLKERLKIIEAVSGASDEERRKQTERAIDAAFTKAPEFGGIDASVGGPAGELMKVDKAQKELEDWYSAQLDMLAKNREERVDLIAEWDAKELDLKRQHEQALSDLERNRQLVQMSAAESTFGSLAEMAKTYAGESSGIYRTLFAVEKGIAIARAAIAIQEGIALAAANPFPLNLAAMASVAAATASLVGNIAAIGLDGQAHGGLEFVPNDGTWNLKKGERIVTANTSAKLDATLTRVQEGMSQTTNHGDRNINVTVALPAGGPSQEQKASGAKIGRQIARAVDAAQRYS